MCHGRADLALRQGGLEPRYSYSKHRVPPNTSLYKLMPMETWKDELEMKGNEKSPS
jgi:hypothetical protein